MLFLYNFFVTNRSAYGIAGCYTQFDVPLSIELSVAVYPELVEGSLTLSFRTFIIKRKT